MMSKIKVGAAFLAAALLLGWALHTGSLKHERDRLRVDLAKAQSAAADLAREIEAGRRALEQREAEKERLANENAALAAALNEVYANDPDAKAWADDSCPDGVLCLLD